MGFVVVPKLGGDRRKEPLNNKKKEKEISCRHKGGDKGNSRARGEKEGAVKRRGKGRCVSGQGQEKPPSATLRVGGCRQKGVLFTSLNYAFRLYTPIIMGAVHNGCVRGRVVSMHRLSFSSSFCFRWFSKRLRFFFFPFSVSLLSCVTFCFLGDVFFCRCALHFPFDLFKEVSVLPPPFPSFLVFFFWPLPVLK